MSLTAGERLGPYEILGSLGAGGMGEVYRARDPKLNRDVAIKVLPQIFMSDPDRLARFEREARVLAALKWGVTRASFAPILASSLVGMMVGGALSGLAGDRFGRRIALAGSVLVFAVFTLSAAAADTLLALADSGSAPRCAVLLLGARRIPRSATPHLLWAFVLQCMHRRASHRFEPLSGCWPVQADQSALLWTAARPCGTAGYDAAGQADGSNARGEERFLT